MDREERFIQEINARMQEFLFVPATPETVCAANAELGRYVEDLVREKVVGYLPGWGIKIADAVPLELLCILPLGMKELGYKSTHGVYQGFKKIGTVEYKGLLDNWPPTENIEVGLKTQYVADEPAQFVEFKLVL